MIDGKKIQKGMKACLDRRIDDKVERENMRDPLIAYTRAFDDAIDWFKQAIWHDISEEPELNKPIIIELNKPIIIERYSIIRGIEYMEDINYSSISWKLHVDAFGITKWCYIEDILSKGGEK